MQFSQRRQPDASLELSVDVWDPETTITAAALGDGVGVGIKTTIDVTGHERRIYEVVSWDPESRLLIAEEVSDARRQRHVFKPELLGDPGATRTETTIEFTVKNGSATYRVVGMAPDGESLQIVRVASLIELSVHGGGA